MDDNFSPIRQRIRQAYKAKGWTQREAAKRAGVPQPVLNRWVTQGKKSRDPEWQNVALLAERWGVDGHWLLTGRRRGAEDRLELIRLLADLGPTAAPDENLQMARALLERVAEAGLENA